MTDAKAEFPLKLQSLFQRSRYKVCYGGRGGASVTVATIAELGSRERHRREPGRVPDAAEGAEEPDAQPDADGGGAWNLCVT